MEKEIQEPGELIFLRYAFPVIGYCNKTPVDAGEISEFEKMLKAGGSPDRKRLEFLFPEAVKHLKSWNPEDVRDYWLVEHNKIVSDNPLCKVYAGEVRKVLTPVNGEICRARIKGLTISSKSYMHLEKGDLISMHALQIAEKLSQEDYNKYFRQ